MKALIVELPFARSLRLTPCPLSALSWLLPMRREGGEGAESFKEVGGSFAAPHLFEFPPLPRKLHPLPRVDSLGGGAGVGARDHGHSGRVGAGARPGAGSTFWHSLPLQGGLA